MYQRFYKVQQDIAKPFHLMDPEQLPALSLSSGRSGPLKYAQEPRSQTSCQSKRVHRQTKEATDKNFLLLNPNFSGLISAIQHKSQSRPELGRILSDKGYKELKYKKKEVALWAFVKE